MPYRRIRPTTAEIDLDAVGYNFRQVRRLLEPTVKIIAVVKASAYGHGAIPIAREFETHGTDMLAVNTIEEGLELRESGIGAPILILSGTYEKGYRILRDANLTPVICRRHDLERLARLGPTRIHLKFDSGMGRLGFWPHEAEEIIALCKELKVIQVEGILSHLASADLPDKKEEVQAQISTFKKLKEHTSKLLPAQPIYHLDNSAGMLCHPESHFDAVRPGIVLYGALPNSGMRPPIDLRPAMRISTEIVHIKDIPRGHGVSYGARFVTRRPSRIAVLPIGYADGLNWNLYPGGRVLVKGRSAPLVGSICMDMCTIDITDLPEINQGEEVVLLGRQNGAEIRAEEIADRLNTISYEILCSFSYRVPRIHRRLTAKSL